MTKKSLPYRRGRNMQGDAPTGDNIKTRYSTSPDKTSVITFPMNDSPASKYPANTMKKITKTQVTPGEWKTKDCIE